MTPRWRLIWQTLEFTTCPRFVDSLAVLSTVIGYLLLGLYGGWQLATGVYLVLVGYAELVVRDRS